MAGGNSGMAGGQGKGGEYSPRTEVSVVYTWASHFFYSFEFIYSVNQVFTINILLSVIAG